MPGSWRAGHWLAIGAILLVMLRVGWWGRAPEVSTGGDEATYILLSRSLERGHYRDEFLRGTPLHAKYPPGTPLWIAAVRQVAGADLDALRAANLVLLALTALLLGDAVRRMTAPWPGVAGVALTALSPPLIEVSGTALSEIPYGFLAMAALWAALVADASTPAGRKAWRGTAVAAALGSFLTRTTGVTVVAGVVAWLALRRRRSEALVALLASSLVVGGWFAYTALAGAHAGAGATYARDLDQVAATGPGGLTGLVLQGAANARAYFLQLPSMLEVPTVGGTVVDNLLWLLGLGLCGAVGLWILLRQWPAAAFHLILSGAVLLVWPWPVPRLLFPLIPVIAGAVVTGSFEVTRGLGRRLQSIVPVGLALALSLSGVLSYVTRDTNHVCDRKDPYGDPRCFTPMDRSLVTAARLIRDSAPAGVVVATSKPSTISYFSHRLTMRMTAASATPDETVWMVLSDLGPRELEAAKRLLAHGCEALGVRARVPRITLVLSRKRPMDPEGEACSAIGEFVREFPR